VPSLKRTPARRRIVADVPLGEKRGSAAASCGTICSLALMS
jgi:hypothetical protein